MQLKLGVLLLLQLLVAGGLGLTLTGLYGWTIFLVLPLLLGGLAGWAFHPSSAAQAAGVGMAAVTMATFAFFLLGFEGAICIAMALPLSLPGGALGGYLAYQARNS